MWPGLVAPDRLGELFHGSRVTANTDHVLPPGTVFQGRYRVVRAIKAGSMGAVYEVVDHKTDSRRALKVMLPGLVDDPDLRRRFVQEAKITGGIESDPLIRGLDADVDVGSGTPFLVTVLSALAGLTAQLAPFVHVARADAPPCRYGSARAR